MVGNRFLIYLKPAFLVSILLIAPNVVPADYINLSSDEVVSVESKKGYGDLEKASSGYMPSPEWLSSVLNWLPPQNHKSRIATFKEDDPDKDIDENFTSPKKSERFC